MVKQAQQVRGLKVFIVGLAAAAGLVATSASAGPHDAERFGVWRNPKDSVRIEIRPCGKNTCGYIISASAKTKANARKHGIDNVIGLQILRDFVPARNDTWRGKVFAPDVNMTFSGTAEFVSYDTLKAKGCVIGQFLCKSQTFTRVEDAQLAASSPAGSLLRAKP